MSKLAIHDREMGEKSPKQNRKTRAKIYKLAAK
jgi:hypothetical protein